MPSGQRKSRRGLGVMRTAVAVLTECLTGAGVAGAQRSSELTAVERVAARYSACGGVV